MAWPEQHEETLQQDYRERERDRYWKGEKRTIVRERGESRPHFSSHHTPPPTPPPHHKKNPEHPPHSDSNGFNGPYGRRYPSQRIYSPAVYHQLLGLAIQSLLEGRAPSPNRMATGENFKGLKFDTVMEGKLWCQFHKTACSHNFSIMFEKRCFCKRQ